ncbi:putative sulfate exporter family transporter [bacterium]|nr:putative sulfate exporter family transporter [bacterium]
MKLKNWAISALLVLVIAVGSYLLSDVVPYFNAIIISLLLGILAGNTLKLSKYKSEIKTIGSRTLEVSLVFLAFGIHLDQLGSSGGAGFMLVIIMIALLLVIGFIIRPYHKGDHDTAWLITFGTAICGSSAIAALGATKEGLQKESAVAIAVVNLIGTIGMLILPLLLVFFESSDVFNGIFLGASLHSVGNVAGAAYTMNPDVGDLALTVKMSRIAMLSPFLIIVNLVQKRGQKKSILEMIKLPWYLIAFIAVTILSIWFQVPESIEGNFKIAGNFFLSCAMAGIGLGLSFQYLWNNAKRGFLYGFLLFAVQLLLVLGLIYLLV